MNQNVDLQECLVRFWNLTGVATTKLTVVKTRKLPLFEREAKFRRFFDISAKGDDRVIPPRLAFFPEGVPTLEAPESLEDDVGV